MNFSFDVIQTLAVAVAVLLLGRFLRQKISALEKFCIPAPVVGGIVFSILALYGHNSQMYFFKFDTLMQTICMTVFFTSVGFSCDLAAFKKFGNRGTRLSIVIIILIIIQNILGLSLAKLFGLNPLIGLSTASVAMTGGHGTSGAFAPLFESMGAKGALTVALASATFGLIGGGLVGGPIGRILYNRHSKNYQNNTAEDTSDIEAMLNNDNTISIENMYESAFQIIVAMGLGTIVSKIMTSIGLTFPAYMGGMIMGMVIRNIAELTGKIQIKINEIDTIGGIGLSIFVSMALMTLKLWELADLAIPLIVMLVSQVVLMFFFSIFVAFKILGSDYDANVMITGVCGFGMGAMPNAVSNMQAFVQKYRPSPTAFLVVPAIGSFVIDISNSILITIFMNFANN